MKRLETLLSDLGLPHDQPTMATFHQYMKDILEWNKMVNLTAITSEDDFIKKHFIDSLLCAASQEFQKAQNIIDVGTGAGFPGIPLAIVCPSKHFVLLDSLQKRLNIIDQLCRKNNIPNATTLHGRAEDIGRQKTHRQQYDLCLSRAVANLSTLSEYCLPLVKTGGTFVAYKGPEVPKELEQSHNAIQQLGGRVDRVEETQKTDLNLQHNLIYIKKESPTPSKYPRKAGTPSKTPLT